MSAPARLAGAVIAAIVALAGSPTASAQSRRYPPEPVDKDAEQARRSNLWSAAITPERHAYDDLVHTAGELLSQAINQHKSDQARLAIEKLDAAVVLLPRDPEAYRLRGEAALELHDWASCARDFAAAEAPAAIDLALPAKQAAEQHRKLGVCQARAGKLTDAEATLAELVVAGGVPGDAALRLGEVRLAMGKLDEAIAALHSALDATDPAASALIHFMLATAYDRARRPADALLEAGQGLKADPSLSVLAKPVLPAVSPGELDYMMGMAYSAEPPRPDYALAYFQRFVKAAPDSPWRKRADDHLRELRTIELPDTIDRAGNAQLDVGAARTATHKLMPQLRGCLANFPGVLVEVEITRSGPRTPSNDPVHARYFSPPDGVAVHNTVGASDAELDEIDRCIDPVAARIALPPVKDHDTFYKAKFHVVGP